MIGRAGAPPACASPRSQRCRERCSLWEQVGGQAGGVAPRASPLGQARGPCSPASRTGKAPKRGAAQGRKRRERTSARRRRDGWLLGGRDRGAMSGAPGLSRSRLPGLGARTPCPRCACTCPADTDKGAHASLQSQQRTTSDTPHHNTIDEHTNAPIGPQQAVLRFEVPVRQPQGVERPDRLRGAGEVEPGVGGSERRRAARLRMCVGAWVA